MTGYILNLFPCPFFFFFKFLFSYLNSLCCSIFQVVLFTNHFDFNTDFGNTLLMKPRGLWSSLLIAAAVTNPFLSSPILTASTLNSSTVILREKVKQETGLIYSSCCFTYETSPRAKTANQNVLLDVRWLFLVWNVD